MEMDRRTALLAAQKFRSMRNGNIVILISLAVILLNAVFAVVGVLTDPIAFMIRGGTETILIFILIGAIASVVGVIIYLVGLYGLRNVRTEYRNAFWWEIGLMIFGILVNIIGKETLFGNILENIGTILSLAVIWLVIRGTKYLMESLQREDLLRQGKMVWRLTAVSTVLAAVYGLIPAGSEIEPRMIALMVIGVIISVLAFCVAIYYVNYLNRVARALDQIGGTMEEVPPL